AALQRAMTIGASYLPTAPAGALDPADAVPELSRRARGFATWAIIRTLGRQGIAALIDQHCRLAHRLAERLAAEPGVAVLNEVDLNQVIVQFGATEPPERRDELTRAVITHTQAAGVCFAGGARWKGRWVMRLSVIAWPMTTSDIDRAAASILAAWRHVQTGSG
ncbi:MAG TPA: pyridoxal-dependent decarboxylase, partial [Candidatus Competibacteraceae bacterium]|nr:pyridoxal-dependent decarboxylase [Candidatus Competibacteraceae bacterium]